MREFRTLYCIGDSHVSFFAGVDAVQPLWPERSVDRLPCFRSFRLGAVLAYNLCDWNTRMRGRENLFAVLHAAVPSGSPILLSFGEIDCRAHLLHQAERQSRPIEEVVGDCVSRYQAVIREVKEKGFPVIVWQAVPSTRANISNNTEFPAYGTCHQRNEVTSLFNGKLAIWCAEEEIPFVSIFGSLVDDKGLTRMEYYMDEIHLSQRAMPLAIRAIEALEGLHLRIPLSVSLAVRGKALARAIRGAA